MAERASLENWRPRKGSASSNLAPSANKSGQEIYTLCFSEIALTFREDRACVSPVAALILEALNAQNPSGNLCDRRVGMVDLHHGQLSDFERQ